MSKLETECLYQIQRLLERADSALIPDMVDIPTARDEVKQAEHLLSVLLECMEE